MRLFRAPRFFKLLFVVLLVLGLGRMMARADEAADLGRGLAAYRSGDTAAAALAGPPGSLGWDIVQWHLLRSGKGVLAEVASAVASAEADITHIDMGEAPGTQTTELNLLLSVRDRLHLADVIRTLKRSGTVLRVARVKP